MFAVGLDDPQFGGAHPLLEIYRVEGVGALDEPRGRGSRAHPVDKKRMSETRYRLPLTEPGKGVDLWGVGALQHCGANGIEPGCRVPRGEGYGTRIGREVVDLDVGDVGVGAGGTVMGVVDVCLVLALEPTSQVPQVLAPVKIRVR